MRLKKETKKRLRVTSILLILSVLLNVYFFGGHKLFEKEGEKIKVVNVVDGDTFDDAEGNRYRLAGLNAPEYSEGCLSGESKERLEELVLEKVVRGQIIKEDKFGRDLVFVFLNGVFINDVLVEEGLAKVEGDDYQYSALLRKSEQEAKTLARGVWSKECLPPEGCVIKGNVRRENGTSLYHLPGCSNYEKIVMSESEGDVWFCTEKEAKKGGFSKSKDCP